MISSDRAVGVLLVLGALVVVPLSASCVSGDLARLGCPVGETCAPAPSSVSFSVPEVSPCAWDGWPRVRSHAVALGGRTYAGISIYARTEWSEHFAPVPMSRDAIAVAEGEGRFTVRDADGIVIELLSLPVHRTAVASVTDTLTCPGEPRALLAGRTYTLGTADPFGEARLQPQLTAADGTLLVDTDATVRALDGGETLIATGTSASLAIRYGGSDEVLLLPVVPAIDDFAPLLSPAEQLAGAIVLQNRALGWVCFRARAAEQVVLGVPATARVVDGGAGWSVEPVRHVPGCVAVEPPYTDASYTLEVTMGGLTRTFVIRAL